MRVACIYLLWIDRYLDRWMDIFTASARGFRGQREGGKKMKEKLRAVTPLDRFFSFPFTSTLVGTI